MVVMVTVTVLLTLLGLAVGSFLNVVIYRVPRGESVVSPGSHCPRCGREIRNRHNIPVLGWLLLRGRCFDCGLPISVRYPLVEAGTGALFALVTWRLLAIDLVAALPAYLWFTAAGIALAMIDLDLRRLPDRIVLPSYGVIAVLLAGASAIRDDWWPLGRAALGAIVLAGCVLTAVRGAGVNAGHVKAAGLVGGVLAYLSWPALLAGAVAAAVLGVIAMIAVRRAAGRTPPPYGLFLVGGALVAILVSRGGSS
jgi:leader peptidase (prepilin peptidase)/N-methyltransferase